MFELLKLKNTAALKNHFQETKKDYGTSKDKKVFRFTT